MSQPCPCLGRFSDAELIAELERRTRSALKHAGELDTSKLLQAFRRKQPEA